MAFTLHERPHTVAAMSNRYIHSDTIMQILQEIENEANMSPSKPSK